VTRVGDAHLRFFREQLADLFLRQIAQRAQLPGEQQDSAVLIEYFREPERSLGRLAVTYRAVVGEQDRVRLSCRRVSRIRDRHRWNTDLGITARNRLADNRERGRAADDNGRHTRRQAGPENLQVHYASSTVAAFRTAVYPRVDQIEIVGR
jgi:hypothetical protein